MSAADYRATLAHFGNAWTHGVAALLRAEQCVMYVMTRYYRAPGVRIVTPEPVLLHASSGLMTECHL